MRLLEWITRAGIGRRIEERRLENAASKAETEREIARGLKRIGMPDEAKRHEDEARRLENLKMRMRLRERRG